MKTLYTSNLRNKGSFKKLFSLKIAIGAVVIGSLKKLTDPEPVLRIRDAYPGSGFFSIPGPGSNKKEEGKN
jgi:hypothetical protein